MIWTDEMTRQLKDLWAEGISASAIGREIGVSKNSVIGKSRRLGLEARPSPIVPAGKKNPRTARPKPREKARISDVIQLTSQMCRWPFGNPDEDDFYFCGKSVVPGKPYCEEHCAIAYVAKSSSRDRTSGSISS